MENNNIEIEKNKEEVMNIIGKIVDKGGNYVIKSMPINNHIKEVLLEVKKVINEKDFMQILKTAISSSINEGMQILGIKERDIGQIDKFVDTAFKGGLTNAINLAIEIAATGKKYGNIFYNYIDDFFSKLKSFVGSKDFKKKVYNNIERCLDKVDNFKELCNDWYDAYDSFNMDEIKDIAGKLNKLKSKVSFNNDCINENTIIQNMTELVNRRKKKLSPIQYDIYTNLYEIQK